MEALTDFDGKIEEALGWLGAASREIQLYDSETGHSSTASIQEALRRCEEARKHLQAIREPIASHIEKALAYQKEQESWTP